MYIRKKIKKTKNAEYLQHQLIESVRTKAGPRQEVVLNMGLIEIDESKWKNLSLAITMKLKGEKEFGFIEIDEEVDKLSDHYVNLIIQQRLERRGATGLQNKDYAHVDVNSIETKNVRSIGLEHIINEEFKRYNLDKILKRSGLNEKEIEYSKLLISSRAIHPSSEQETVRWIKNNSGISEILGLQSKVYDNALFKTAKVLINKQEEIEKRLREKSKDLFSLSEKIILYDLTNTYFEGQQKESKILKYGKSKERRNDCKQATLALVVDSEGFPKKSKILEGNISEAKTFKYFLKEIKELGNSKTIVMEAGIATIKNIKLIKEKGLSYIVVSKRKNYKESFWSNEEEKAVNLKEKGETLKLKLKKTEEEAYLLCTSKRKEYRDKDIWAQKTIRFENQLDKIKEGLNKKGYVKSYDKIMIRIGRLKEKYHIGDYYSIEVEKEHDHVKSIRYKKNEKAYIKEQKYGTYVLRTNRLDLNEEEISRINRSLWVIESSFKYMKTDLGIRPNYYKTDIGAKAHILISVLSYTFIISIIKRLRQSNCRHSWSSIKKILCGHVRVTTSFETKDKYMVHIKHCSTPNEDQKKIYNILGIKIKPLKNQKIKIHKT